jgi:hypothetical protein
MRGSVQHRQQLWLVVAGKRVAEAPEAVPAGGSRRQPALRGAATAAQVLQDLCGDHKPNHGDHKVVKDLCVCVMGFINNRDGVTIVALKPIPLEPYPRPLNKRLTNLQILTTMCVCVFPPPVKYLDVVAPPAAIHDLD